MKHQSDNQTICQSDNESKGIMESRRPGGSAVVVLLFPSAAKMAAFHNLPAAKRGRAGAHPSSDIASQCSLRSGDIRTPQSPATSNFKHQTND